MATIAERLRVSGAAYMDAIIEDAESELPSGMSPIEAAFATAYVALTRIEYAVFGWHRESGSTIECIRANARLDGDRAGRHGHVSRLWGVMAPQVKILSYRVDFAVLYRSGVSDVAVAVVECDGHQFHERTRAQAEHDKARDRDIQALGYRVFRFTGSEIWRDPFKAAGDVLSIVHDHAQTSAHAAHLLGSGSRDGADRELNYIGMSLPRI
jgi:very-short-patch-repair endonuclease